MINKNQKIGALALVVLGILIFMAFSIHLILFKLSLPPYSARTEGKYVAYGLEIWGFLWSIPVVVSLFLLAYLVYPSKFGKSSKLVNILFMLLTIGGFGITALLVALAIINNFPPADYILMFISNLIVVTSPFWIMGVLALSAFKKEKFEKDKREA